MFCVPPEHINPEKHNLYYTAPNSNRMWISQHLLLFVSLHGSILIAAVVAVVAAEEGAATKRKSRVLYGKKNPGGIAHNNPPPPNGAIPVRPSVRPVIGTMRITVCTIQLR